jgi:hypothetical protein
MAIDPSIALQVRPIEVPNQLAQYAQMAQLQTMQNQNQVAQMQFEKMRQHENYLTKMQEAISKNGGPDLMTAASLMAQSPDQNVQMHGIQMLQAQQELAAYNKKFNAPTTATGGFGGAPVPNGSLGSGTFGINPEPAPMNALAPKVELTPSKNALAVDVNSLRQELMDLSQYPNVPQAKLRANIIQEQLKEAMKAHVVPNVGLVSGAGQTIVASGMTPTDIKRLTAERDALPVGDPNRKIYDQAIADVGATARVAQQRLAFDQSKFAWEKSNPGYELKEDADGNFFGVNKRTLQAVPVTVGGPAPVAAPMAQTGMPSARLPAATTVQAIPGMTSVLDQTVPVAPAAPVVGGPRQLVGKAKEAPAKFHDIDMQLSGLAGSLKSFKDEIKNEPTTGAPFLPKGSDTARMQAKYTSLLMGLKDLYTLGALTGPDMSIIESQINNPASWSGKLATYKGIKEQTKVIEDMLQRSTQNVENSYGRKPNATIKAMEPLKNLPGASDSDPLGLLKGKQ